MKKMNTEQIHTTQSHEQQGYAIDYLLAKFGASVESTAASAKSKTELVEALREYNPWYDPVKINGKDAKATVMEQVVAGVYAPLIHGFANALVENIKLGNLPNVVICPPRDAIPLLVSLKQTAKLAGLQIKFLTPDVNRNTAGIENNQKAGETREDELFPELLTQVAGKVGQGGVVEVETGIYGTTSMVMATALKQLGVSKYVSVKFYGLGPNLSYVHAVLSGGKCWLAEKSEELAWVDSGQVEKLMVLVDTLEEFGMQNGYRSVEKLRKSKSGAVVGEIAFNGDETRQLAYATNMAVYNTTKLYYGVGQGEIRGLLERVPWLVEKSKTGLPLTLEAAIPSMDSKEEHFARIRRAGVFDYPELVLGGK